LKNKKVIIVTSALIFSSLLSAGCMMGGGDMSDMDMNKKDSDSTQTRKAPQAKVGMSKCGDDMKMDKNTKLIPDVSTEPKSKSYIIASRYCTQCHNMREVNEFNKDEWRPIVNRMISYMQKTDKTLPDSYEKLMIEHYYGID